MIVQKTSSSATSAHKGARAHLQKKNVVCLSPSRFQKPSGSYVHFCPRPCSSICRWTRLVTRRQRTLDAWSVHPRALSACVTSPGDWAVCCGGQVSCASTSKRTFDPRLRAAHVQDTGSQNGDNLPSKTLVLGVCHACCTRASLKRVFFLKKKKLRNERSLSLSLSVPQFFQRIQMRSLDLWVQW